MMSTFQKLNLKDHSRILVLNPPESFEPELAALQGVTVLRKLQGLHEIGFSLAFVTKQQEVEKLAKAIPKLAKGDAVVWFGLWLLACSHWLGLLVVISPVYMTNMLVRHTGKKLLEKHMARSKGAAYADYVRRTSGFVPWPPQ